MINLIGDVDKEMVRKIFQEADNFTQKEVVKISLCSRGGDLSDALAIYDKLSSLPNEVQIYAYGEVFSSAIIVLLAGDQRFGSPNCSYLWHPTEMSAEGGLDDVTKEVDHTKELDLMSNNIILEKTNVTNHKLKAISKKEYYFYDDEARELGFIE